MSGRKTDTGENLRLQWGIPAIQARYLAGGTWFMPLSRFPGALCDEHGYVVFPDQHQYETCPHLRIGKRVNVRGGIAKIPGYHRFAEGHPPVPPPAVEGLLQDAVAVAEELRARGESPAHKLLKERVAANPLLAGFPVGCKAVVEHRFPSGDKVDVAFEYPDGQWAMVEIELEGLAENTIGLFQAVKYKALQEAVLRTKTREGTVVAGLVAHRVEPEIKTMAACLGIRVAEVPRV
jgi:hypothetical protein